MIDAMHSPLDDHYSLDDSAALCRSLTDRAREDTPLTPALMRGDAELESLIANVLGTSTGPGSSGGSKSLVEDCINETMRRAVVLARGGLDDALRDLSGPDFVGVSFF
jgi:hypothetical protein